MNNPPTAIRLLYFFKPIIMKTTIILIALALGACTLQPDAHEPESVPIDFYLGRWALDLDYDRGKAGWLEVTQEDGYIDARLLWRGGSVNPVDFIFLAEGHLMVVRGRTVVRKTNEDGTAAREHFVMNWLNIKKDGDDAIFGMALFPGADGVSYSKVSFTGKRIPEPGKAPDLSALDFADPIELFNGKDLSGWKLLEPDAENGWKVAEGVLMNDPVQKEGEPHKRYGNLRTVDEFEDFNLKLEVSVPEGSNSGVYLRGIYEIQVADTYGQEPDSHHMGGLYSRITPSETMEKPAGEWQSLDITLVDRHLTVILNGTTIIDNQPVYGVTGGAITANEFIPGPIYLQGDHGEVRYRNIVLTPIK
jgi:hypothetical protein